MEIGTLTPALITAVAAVGVAMLTFVLNRVVRPRARLKFNVRSQFSCEIKIPDSGRTLNRTLNTVQMSLVNNGNDVAKKVEIALTGRPAGISTSPNREYTLRKSRPNIFILGFDSLAAGERLDLEMVSIGSQTAEVATVRSENCKAVRTPKLMQRPPA